MSGQLKLPRQIVICCDGTNNTLTGGADDTNVVTLHNHLSTQQAKVGWERILYYDPGVGSPGLLPPTGPIDWLARTWDRLSGLASGGGVFENIADAYRFLMRHWRDNDDLIYLFGFSRGAFTVRAVAGMVNLFGVVRPEYDVLVPTLVHLYFAPTVSLEGNPLQRTTRWLHRLTSRRQMAAAEPGGHARLGAADGRTLLAEEVRANFAGDGRCDAWVHWVGVWDTVESVGLPGLLSRVNPAPPTVLGKRFLNLRHALSLDEHRWPFLPRLYEEPGDIDQPLEPLAGSTAPRRQTLKQRWYPGVHCDSGGSYAQTQSGISDAALRWMVDEVADDLGIEPMKPHPPGEPVPMWRHDSMWDTPYWALAGMTLRDMHSRFERPDRADIDFKAIPADNLPLDQPIFSVWEKRRPMWPIALSVGLGLIFLIASGRCLSSGSEIKWWAPDPMTLVRAVQAAQDFAGQQLSALWGKGLRAQGHRPWELIVQPGWAMFWDVGFIACWGYLLARVCSRAFAWLAGDRRVDSGRPMWRLLGFAPMVAVIGDACEDLSVWLAMALNFAGTDGLAVAVLWAGAVCSALKFAGLAGCLLLLVVGWRINFKPGNP
jgi:uncharacterized protein (DUF2235 family)